MPEATNELYARAHILNPSIPWMQEINLEF